MIRGLLLAGLSLVLWRSAGYVAGQLTVGRAAGRLLVEKGRSVERLRQILTDPQTWAEVSVEAARRHPLLAWSVSTQGCGCSRCRFVRAADHTQWVRWTWPLWVLSYADLVHDVLEERTRPWSVEADAVPAEVPADDA